MVQMLRLKGLKYPHNNPLPEVALNGGKMLRVSRCQKLLRSRETCLWEGEWQ